MQTCFDSIHIKPFVIKSMKLLHAYTWNEWGYLEILTNLIFMFLSQVEAEH